MTEVRENQSADAAANAQTAYSLSAAEYTLTLVDPEAGDAGIPLDEGADIEGGDGNDDLRGGPGNDHLQGLGGQDFLLGNIGDDVLEGGDDDDLLLGDDANPLQQIFFRLFPDGMSVDEDRIDLSAFAGIDSIDDLNLQQHDGYLIIDLLAHGGGEINVQDVNQADLSDTHFIFHADPETVAAA